MKFERPIFYSGKREIQDENGIQQSGHRTNKRTRESKPSSTSSDDAANISSVSGAILNLGKYAKVRIAGVSANKTGESSNCNQTIALKIKSEKEANVIIEGITTKTNTSSVLTNDNSDTRSNEVIGADLNLGTKSEAKIGNVSTEKTGESSGHEKIKTFIFYAGEETTLSMKDITTERNSSSCTPTDIPNTRSDEVVGADINVGKNSKADIGNVTTRKIASGSDKIDSLILNAEDGLDVTIGDVSIEEINK